MKLRGLILSTAVLLALVGTLYWSEHRKPKEETTVSADTSPAILKLDEASIAKVDLRKKDAAPIALAKNSSGSWQLTEPKQLNADQNAVSSMVSTLSSLRSERVVDDKPSDLNAYGLTQPALEVDLAEKDNKSQKLLIGDDTPTGSSVYAMLTGDPRVFTIASYNKTSFDKSVNDLRDKRLLTVASDKIGRLDLIRNNQTIEFGRDKDEWQILKPKPLRADSMQVGELVQKLTDARMDISGSDAGVNAASAFTHGTLVATAKVTDLSGTQELQVRKDKDNYYAKSSVVEGAYKVDSSLGQAMDKGLDDFRNKKIFDFGFSDPDKIEMRNGSKGAFLSRSGADWWSNGKKMDPISAQDFVSALRDLQASKLVDSGFTSPAVEITVTSDSDKKVEKVSIAKSGNACIAKRENDPTLYQLDANTIDSLQKSADEIKSASERK
jgi:Domain of unknown function (DUF4340)